MEKDKKFSQTLIEKIKDNNISPRPRWQFLFKNYVLWFFGVLSLILGAMSVSLIIYMLRCNEWTMYWKNISNPLEAIILAIPFFWIICLIIFVILVYWEFKKTKKGYRYSTIVVILGAISATILLGSVFYSFGLGSQIDDVLSRRAPFYERIINPSLAFWSQPERGRLSGLIIAQPDQNNLILFDIKKKEWKVFLDNPQLLNGNNNFIEIGRPVHFLGKKIKDGEFKADKALPVLPGRKFFHRPKMKPPVFAPKELEKDDFLLMKKSVENDLLKVLDKYPEIKDSLVNNLKNYQNDPLTWEIVDLLEG